MSGFSRAEIAVSHIESNCTDANEADHLLLV